MAKKKKKDLDVYENDICEETSDIVNDILETANSTVEPVPILDVTKDFVNIIAIEEEEKVRKKEVLTPAVNTSPSQVLRNNINNALKINLKPGTNPLNNAIANPVENDNLVAVLRDNKPTNTVLHAVMEEIAEEAAYIKAWRNENWNTGEDLSEATFKRIKMLKHLVETVIEQEKLKRSSAIGKVDFHGEAFERVLKYFLKTIQKTFKTVSIPSQYEDIFFTELAKEFDGFEKIAERIYYGKE